MSLASSPAYVIGFTQRALVKTGWDTYLIREAKNYMPYPQRPTAGRQANGVEAEVVCVRSLSSCVSTFGRIVGLRLSHLSQGVRRPGRMSRIQVKKGWQVRSSSLVLG